MCTQGPETQRQETGPHEHSRQSDNPGRTPERARTENQRCTHGSLPGIGQRGNPGAKTRGKPRSCTSIQKTYSLSGGR